MKIGFDNKLYLKLQSEKILERIKKFNNKLYLEFGGKLFDDYHAARCMPGFDPKIKIKLLQTLKDKAEIVFCISADDIQHSKVRADFGITYDLELLRLVDNFRKLGLYVGSIVITKYTGQVAADNFKKKLENLGEKCYIHTLTKGYPTDVETIVSDEGYGANPYIETTRPLVVITAPGPSSGKLGTCLSQLYHEYKRGIKAGYSKFETFPVWNVPLKHPLNIAYEAATVDLKDVNMIDSFHLEKYGTTAVNYNRDIEVFPVVKNIIKKITGEDLYYSPTDMGVNMAGFCIIDDDVVKEASKKEIIRRYYKAKCDNKLGKLDKSSSDRAALLMKEVNISPEERAVVAPALEKAKITGTPSMAIQLNDGRIVTGKTTDIMDCTSAAVLNSIKLLANIDDNELLISRDVLLPIQKLKRSTLNMKKDILNLQETLLALAVSANTSKQAAAAYDKLSELKNCEAHVSVMLDSVNESVLRKLFINFTCEAEYPSKDLFFS